MTLSKKSLKKLRGILLEVTPEITAILDDFMAINKMRSTASDMSEEDAADAGVTVVKELLDMLLIRRYDGIIQILAALYEVTPDELEDRNLGEIMDMITETLSDEAPVRFFPQFGQLARKTRPAI